MRNKKTKIKKAVILIALVSLILSQSGCWSYHELNSFSFVVALGIDKGSQEGRFKFIEQLAMPGGLKSGGGAKGGGGDAFWNVENEGDTMFSTIRDITRIIQRKPFFGHNKIIVIGKEAAKEGILRYLDLMARDTEPRITTWIVVAKDKASEILNLRPHLDKIPADKIEKVLEGHTHTSQFHNIQIKEFLEDMLSKSKASVVPIIELIKQEDITKEAGRESSGGDKGDEDAKDTVAKINKSAVFKDYKMVGELDNIQARGYSFITNNVKSGIVVITDPESKDKIDLEITNAKGGIKPVIKGDEISIKVNVKVNTSLGGQGNKTSHGKSEELKKLEKELEKEVKDEIESSIKAAKEMKADIFGFANAVYRKNPKKWKDIEEKWDDMFKDLKVEVNVEAKILGTAAIKSLALPKG